MGVPPGPEAALPRNRRPRIASFDPHALTRSSCARTGAHRRLSRYSGGRRRCQTMTIPIDRRAVLAGIAGVGVTGQAVAADGPADPHAGWLAACRRLEAA